VVETSKSWGFRAGVLLQPLSLLQKFYPYKDLSHNWWIWSYFESSNWVVNYINVVVLRVLNLFLSNFLSYNVSSDFLGRKLNGFLGNAWPRRWLWRRNQEWGQRLQKSSQQLRTVKVSSHSLILLISLRMRMILMMMLYVLLRYVQGKQCDCWYVNWCLSLLYSQNDELQDRIEQDYNVG